MEQSLVLTFDVGTQSARCLLVNESGDFEDKEQQKYKVPYLSKQPGWAEQTPDFYFNIIADYYRSASDLRIIVELNHLHPNDQFQ